MASADTFLINPPRDVKPGALTLALLESRQLPVEWYEAVAIIQGLCRAILDSGDTVGPAVINASAVTISPAGRIETEASGPRSARAAIQRVGQLLSMMLPPDGVPVGLTAVSWKAVDNPPHYASLREFSQALAYFERPNGVNLIKAVYERGQQLNAPVRPEVVQPASPPPVPEPEPVKQEEVPVPRRISIPWRPIVVASACTLAAVAVIWTVLAFPNAPRRGLSSIASVSASVWRATTNLFPSESPNVGTSNEGSAAASESVESPTPEKPASPRKPPAAPAKPQPRASIARSRNTPAASPSPMVRPAAPVEPTSLPPSDRIDTSHAPSAPETPHTIQPPVRMAATVLPPFSSGDLEVTPPRPIAQQRVGPLFSTVDVVTIAVMIREDGTVESVKAQTRPKTISESLLLANSLSVAKSWRFYPAMKDGRAVPYRAIVSLNTH